MNKEIINVMKALSDETRIDMVVEIYKKGEVSCQESSSKFDLSQPTLSHHYKKLIDAGIIKVRKEGVNHFYSVDNKLLETLGIDLSKFIK